MTPRVAIACSGLGHVFRGNETWAATVGEGLHKSGGNVIVFGSGPRPDARSPYVRVPCLRRDGWIRRFFSWDKAYLWEQVTFARNLRRHMRADRFDIVHCADPNLAQQLIGRSKRHGLALIYQDSLFIGPRWCSKFENVQVLAPYYEDLARKENMDTRGWRVIPQTVDTRVFSPSPSKTEVRRKLLGASLPAEALVAVAVGDFSEQGGKRFDWILSEFAQARTQAHLIVAGNALAEDLQRLQGLAQPLKGRVHFLTGVPHREMPSVYQAADLFIHAATREPFGLVLIEAMACALPVIGHTFETTQWIVAEGGTIIDMTKSGELANAVDSLFSDHELRLKLSAAAISRVKKVFDRDIVLPMYHSWYHELAARQQHR